VRVTAVCREIEQVVQYIPTRGTDAEGEEGQGRPAEQGVLCDAMRGEERYKDEEVLQPLVQAQGSRVEQSRVLSIVDHLLHLRHPICRHPSAELRIHHDSLPGRAPHGDVASRVANVVKALFTELLHQAVPFPSRGEVGDSVTRYDQVEELEVLRHLAGKGFVRPRGKNQPASLATLGPQVFDEPGVVRKEAHLQGDSPADLPLQGSCALEQPEWQQKEVERVSSEEGHEGLRQEVALDQGAVEVHDQGWGRGRLTGRAL